MTADIPVIPFNRPTVEGDELVYVQQAIELGHLSGDGSFTRRCEGLLEELLNAPRVLLTSSCTHALEMAALLLRPKKLRAGARSGAAADAPEVVLPSFTFVTSANAFVLHGWRPVFVDVRPDTLNLDESLLDDLVTDATGAIVAVHYGGVACAMETISAIADGHGAGVVEDNAHGLFGRHGERPLGTIGDLGTQSFHETKNISCGEGGALVINDASLGERAEIIRDKGTDRARMFRGEIDKYTWCDLGSSYLMSELQAAYLFAQLEARDHIQQARGAIWNAYRAGLADWADARGVQLPIIPPGSEQSYHMFFLVMPEAEDRDALIAHLKGRGVHSVFHYLPLHLSEMGRRYGGREGDCPVTESVAARLLRLPFYNSLSAPDTDRVIDAVLEFDG